VVRNAAYSKCNQKLDERESKKRKILGFKLIALHLFWKCGSTTQLVSKNETPVLGLSDLFWM